MSNEAMDLERAVKEMRPFVPAKILPSASGSMQILGSAARRAATRS
jgi:hypothetical protein